MKPLQCPWNHVSVSLGAKSSFRCENQFLSSLVGYWIWISRGWNIHYLHIWHLIHFRHQTIKRRLLTVWVIYWSCELLMTWYISSMIPTNLNKTPGKMYPSFHGYMSYKGIYWVYLDKLFLFNFEFIFTFVIFYHT